MAEAAPNSDANVEANASPAEPAGGDLSVSMPESWRAAASGPSGPTDRVALIENSLRCLTYGWLSLVPVAGAFFVIPAVRMFQRVDRERAEWNPAAHLWLRGLVLASFGFWASLLSWWLLLWWGGIGPELVNVPEGDMALLLFYLGIFGSIPTLLGLGLAAARLPNRFGVFVLRFRRVLLSLMAMGYGVLLLILSMEESLHPATRLNGRTGSIYGLLMVWLVWLLGGFLLLALRGAKAWVWLVWVVGAAALTLWVAAN